MKNQTNGERKLIALGYVYIVEAHNPNTRNTRIIGVYETEQTARERIEDLRKCWVIRDEDVVTINPEEVWGWDY